jgi:hypothetical protein
MLTTTPTPSLQRNSYHAYLVRLWQDDPHTPWRASTHCTQTGEKRLFADLQALFVFLNEQTTTRQPGDTNCL